MTPLTRPAPFGCRRRHHDTDPAAPDTRGYGASSGAPDGAALGEVIPPTGRADLDHIARADRLAARNPIHLTVRRDTASVLGQPRPEDIGDLDEGRLLAHRTVSTGGCAAELRIADEFPLRIAQLFSAQITIAKRRQCRLARQPIVDPAGGGDVLEAQLGARRHARRGYPSPAPPVAAAYRVDHVELRPADAEPTPARLCLSLIHI